MKPEEITQILSAARRGEGDAAEQLFPLVYERLRRSARGLVRKWRPGETMNSGALVHETYLKLVGSCDVEWRDRGHFFAVAGKAMREILLDHARRHTAQKRGGGERPLSLHDSRVGGVDRTAEIFALNEALEQLEQRDARLVRLVELRFFAGLTAGEAADALGMSERTAMRDWRKARAFLHKTLGEVGG